MIYWGFSDLKLRDLTNLWS